MCPPSRSPTRSDRSRLTGEPGAVKRLGHDVGAEVGTGQAGDGQAGPIDRDRVAGPRIGRDPWPAHGDPGGAVEAIDRYDFAEFFYYSGEHPRLRLLRAVL